LQETAGRYATSLKWLETTQPGGAIARLTIGLSRTLPVAPAGGSIEEIAHEISARLVYAVPVESAAGDASESWLSIPLGAVNRVDEQASQLVLDVNTKAEFDRLWSAMTNPAAKGRLELRCFATIGRRTWRQVIPDRVGLLDQMSLLNDRGVLLTHIVKPPPLIQVEPQRPPWRRPPVRELRPDFRRSVLTEPASPLVINAAPMRMRAVRTLDTAMMMRDVATPLSVLADSPAVELTPVASRRALHDVFRPEMAEAVQVSDLLVDRKRVLPIRAIIDKRGRPALIRINAEAVQSVPFGFDVGLNAYMFDVPGVRCRRGAPAGGLLPGLGLPQSLLLRAAGIPHPTSRRGALSARSQHRLLRRGAGSRCRRRRNPLPGASGLPRRALSRRHRAG
jgi:hypothetical protein